MPYKRYTDSFTRILHLFDFTHFAVKCKFSPIEEGGKSIDKSVISFGLA